MLGGIFPPKDGEFVRGGGGGGGRGGRVEGGLLFAVHNTFVHVDVVCPVQEPSNPAKTRHLHESSISLYSPPSLPCWAIPRNLCSHENITIQLKRKTDCNVSRTIWSYPAILPV